MTIQYYIKLLLSKLFLVFLLFGCQNKPDFPPEAIFSCYPSTGDTSTFFRFDASESLDTENELWQLSFRWDFNRDGQWDTEIINDPTLIWRFQNFGIYHVVMEVIDRSGQSSSYTQEVYVVPNFIDSVFTDTRDGHTYKAVLIDHIWWMAEDLQFGNSISLTSDAQDNNVTEKYVNPRLLMTNQAEIGYYTWYEVTDYQRKPISGICPEGWRLISFKDQMWLDQRFSQFGDPIFYFKPGGYLGIDFNRLGFFSLFDRKFYGESGGLLWMSDQPLTNGKLYNYVMNYGNNYHFGYYLSSWPAEYLDNSFWQPEWGATLDFKRLAFNVRCVKDAN